MTYFEIPECNLEDLRKRVARIEKKCVANNCNFNYQEIGECFKEIEIDKKKQFVRFIQIEAEGKAIVNDWEFVCELEHTVNGNLIRSFSQDNLDRFYSIDAQCEHCHTNHDRKYTYIVKNTITGEYKQVGKACLKLYTNGMDVSTICYVLQFLDDIEDMQHSANFTANRYFDVWEVLDRTVTIVDENGYVKSGEPGCTSEKVRFELGSSSTYKLLHTDIVKNIIDWILSINANNDYLHNLQIICKSRYVGYKNLNLLISLYPTYLKALAKEQERSAKVNKSLSAYVGNVGDKITINVKNWRPVTGYETQWGYMLIIEFVDENGNVYIWKTQSFNASKFEKENLVISATIKEHSIYNDIKQTVVTRCKVK